MAVEKRRSALLAACAHVLVALCVSGLALAPGRSEAQSSWQYTALGDSLAVGAIALRGYVPRYQSYVRTDTGASVSLRNLGQFGWTSPELLTALRTDGNFRNSVIEAEVVTWDIGGNDLRHARESYQNATCGGADNQQCLRDTLAVFKESWDGIIAEILLLRGEQPGAIRNTIIRTMDLYNPFVDEDRAIDTDGNGINDFLELKPYVDAANQHIADSATANGIPFARVYRAFNGLNGDVDPQRRGFLSFDRVHPNDTGHKVIADLLRALRYLPLSTR
jgi:lysophospholipase L1-like esterase